MIFSKEDLKQIILKRSKYQQIEVPDRPDFKPDKRFFHDTAFGRTLTMRNKTGKIAAGVLATAVSATTGINIETQPIMEGIGTIEMAISLGAIVLSFVIGLIKTAPKTKEKLNVLVDYLADELQKAVDEKSHKGETISRQEISGIVQGIFKRVFN